MKISHEDAWYLVKSPALMGGALYLIRDCMENGTVPFIRPAEVRIIPAPPGRQEGGSHLQMS